jgi:predicted enzyme related to lactoylglutathione lyase
MRSNVPFYVRGDHGLHQPIELLILLLGQRSCVDAHPSLPLRDFASVKPFYLTHVQFPVVEEIESEWAVFQAGGVELTLHLAGKRHRENAPPVASSERAEKLGSTVKFVFSIDTDLSAHREKLEAAGGWVGLAKRYDAFPCEMYDARDPEGNVFQVMRLDCELVVRK